MMRDSKPINKLYVCPLSIFESCFIGLCTEYALSYEMERNKIQREIIGTISAAP